MEEAKKTAQAKMQDTLDHLSSELKKIRTGRANPQMLEGITIEVYGQQTPLAHVASINAVDAQMLQITPFDPNNLDAISTAIRQDKSMGLNPADDGKLVRVPIPPLTEDRRKEIAKTVHEKAEEAKISFRNARRDWMDVVKKAEKASDISKDDLHDGEKAANAMIDDFQTKTDNMVASKEKELLTV